MDIRENAEDAANEMLEYESELRFKLHRINVYQHLLVNGLATESSSITTYQENVDALFSKGIVATAKGKRNKKRAEKLLRKYDIKMKVTALVLTVILMPIMFLTLVPVFIPILRAIDEAGYANLAITVGFPAFLFITLLAVIWMSIKSPIWPGERAIRYYFRWRKVRKTPDYLWAEYRKSEVKEELERLYDEARKKSEAKQN